MPAHTFVIDAWFSKVETMSHLNATSSRECSQPETVQVNTPKKEVSVMTKDPVCGMQIDEKKAAASTEHLGKTYYFCSESCKQEFNSDPHKYMHK